MLKLWLKLDIRATRKTIEGLVLGVTLRKEADALSFFIYRQKRGRESHPHSLMLL